MNRTAIEKSDATGPAIAGVGRALPAHHVSQEVLTEALRAHWAKAHFNPARLDDLHRAVGVKGRYLALPLDAYPALDSFAKSNSAWLEAATELGAAALSEGLARAGLRPDQLDHLFFVTVTGVATPTVDARLVNRLGLRSDVKRTPIFGLGCVAGAAGLARASGLPARLPRGGCGAAVGGALLADAAAEDLSIPNMIASGLFGDGAAAVVLRGVRAGPRRRSIGPRTAPGSSRAVPSSIPTPSG